ncbi:M20 family metallopeptidase [Brevibacterium sp. 91QC2O2]|uniref:M20 metallopeptidase family protein n=1 Tax=Brevibacterium sp. 91QC2O2 TaxID=2968458 RepID=UPI00211C0999|nr:M20 family metallopeptidase [Brevibacterium sp. 91QC2O2]MCQ9367432.1 M20 family metallopeptidase [Brevibacterium sp. 91QC2O2]
MTSDTCAEQRARATELQPRLVELRRDIHGHPEIGLELPRTQQTVLDALAGLDGLEITRGTGLNSLAIVLRGGRRDPEHPRAVLLRADMDALPVTEATGFDFASTNGAMHACGHDLHTTGLVGAVHLLHAIRGELAGDVLFMFQPGEEGQDGAGRMLAEGLLDVVGVPVIAAYGVHVSADQPAGNVYSRRGSYMAAFNRLNVTVHGRGGHAARPYAALDPIQAAADIIGQLQVWVTRRIDPFDPIVLTVGQFNAGTAPNIIPDEATFIAGVRTFSQETTEYCARELPRLIEGAAAAHGLRAEVDFATVVPATINDDAEADFYLECAGELFGAQRVHTMEHPRTASEDFSRVLQAVPGSYGHFGAALADVDPQDWQANHSPRARHTDTALADHALFLAELARRRLLV